LEKALLFFFISRDAKGREIKGKVARAQVHYEYYVKFLQRNHENIEGLLAFQPGGIKASLGK